MQYGITTVLHFLMCERHSSVSKVVFCGASFIFDFYCCIHDEVYVSMFVIVQNVLLFKHHMHATRILLT